jgi:DsbC/DsbD-like thiol-disulfide interchange protein
VTFAADRSLWRSVCAQTCLAIQKNFVYALPTQNARPPAVQARLSLSFSTATRLSSLQAYNFAQAVFKKKKKKKKKIKKKKKKKKKKNRIFL